MRYEAKHSHLKHLARVIHNFKNVPKTLALRHQNYMCVQLLDKDGYLRPQVETSSGMSVTFAQYMYIMHFIKIVKIYFRNHDVSGVP